jgi:hypothetical protein
MLTLYLRPCKIRSCCPIRQGDLKRIDHSQAFVSDRAECVGSLEISRAAPRLTSPTRSARFDLGPFAPAHNSPNQCHQHRMLNLNIQTIPTLTVSILPAAKLICRQLSISRLHRLWCFRAPATCLLLAQCIPQRMNDSRRETPPGCLWGPKKNAPRFDGPKNFADSAEKWSAAFSTVSHLPESRAPAGLPGWNLGIKDEIITPIS